MKTDVLGKNDITKEIENKFVKKECLDIGNLKNWTKNCPKCGKEQMYKTKEVLKKAIKSNRCCSSCVRKEISKIGDRFGKLTITNQYQGQNRRTLVDYVCECGNVKIGALITNVKYQKSCNKCQNRGVTKKPYGESSFNNLYNRYKQNAKNRGYDFFLTKEKFRELTKKNCFYCGREPDKVMKTKRCNGEYLYNGIDRMDNTKGYSLENSVPCCKFCNLTKNDTSFIEFINWIRTVYKNTEKLDMDKIPCNIQKG